MNWCSNSFVRCVKLVHQGIDSKEQGLDIFASTAALNRPTEIMVVAFYLVVCMPINFLEN
jgi:hypothetical protein